MAKGRPPGVSIRRGPEPMLRGWSLAGRQSSMAVKQGANTFAFGDITYMSAWTVDQQTASFTG